MELPSRKNIRLQSWDYSTHAYYHVTICTHNRLKLLSTVDPKTFEVKLSDIGNCVDDAIAKAVERYPSVRVETYVIMPNHVHMLVAVDEQVIDLGRFIGFMKSYATRCARRVYPNLELWQRNYYDHILWKEKDYHAAWQYIADNPAKWATDDYYVE